MTEKPEQPPADTDFERLVDYLQSARGLDFRGYKRSSLQRRVRKRMEAVGAADYAAYLARLESDPAEVAGLLDTILINVTGFFRDPEAWQALERKVLPSILADKPPGRPIRAWSVGCASGEEPYSLAILLAEAIGIERLAEEAKIYATDLDEDALATARHAIYPAKSLEGLPEKLVESYFERLNDGRYAIRRELRKAAIFGRHNVVEDPPISRIDLLLCRNLLIYLEAETQNRILPRLHYALADSGYLFLGKAETQLARSRSFQPVDVKARLFRKKPQEWRRGTIAAAGEPAHAGKEDSQARLFEALIDAGGTAYVVVDAKGCLAFANLAARQLFRLVPGDIRRPFHDLELSYRPAELRSRIEEVARTGQPARIEDQEYRLSGDGRRFFQIDIVPLHSGEDHRYGTALLFTDTTRIATLRQELATAQESLETTVEELQSSNEELETTNEELQSTNEELETMNEELRATNEELQVTNEELRLRTDEAAEYRRYTDAVLRSLDFGIVVLDRQLRISSWNRWMENRWGLRADEAVGRSLADLDIGLPLHRLQEPARQARRGGGERPPIELEAIDRRGRALRCEARPLPLQYESGTNGVLLLIDDVSEARRAEQHAAYLGRILGAAANEIYLVNAETWRFHLVNSGAERKLGYSLDQLRQQTLYDILPDISEQRFLELVAPRRRGEKEELVFETFVERANGSIYPAQICLQLMPEESPPLLVAMVQDIGERQVERRAAG